MMNCPLCGCPAHTRSSFVVTSETKERYHQCTNINCSLTFVSHETVVRVISKPQLINMVEPHPAKNGQSVLAF
ncbi:MAG: ogr/Delta-like zinc finger family protein [Hafnia sp.]|uniref:ogr/Delta-like zinc finger family protein n=1 Tax=Hafnia TaxID=568 RepID=UPI001034947B|nr:ogr/Delta-like zinc finger family protein [Hafnia alvei]TBM24351.1 transcriptional regulator [Hafnia alvei]